MLPNKNANGREEGLIRIQDIPEDPVGVFFVIAGDPE
jgi:hypothetical protein